ncbi:hypothetical protein [Streptomyces sp. NPDC020298]|uniref:hypothetical protein n=1 Tax=unclassified Streptomyces TaxID=2593676 RepID=UPI0033CA30D0
MRGSPLRGPRPADPRHARELVRALKHPDHPLDVGDDLADVFAYDSLKEYEHLALVGELRGRGAKRPTSEATANVRSGVMALLQRELGLKVVHLRPQEEQPRKEPVDVARRERMRESLQTVADLIGHRTHWTAEGGLLTRSFPRWVRMLAMASVTLDTGCRVGELCAIRLEPPPWRKSASCADRRTPARMIRSRSRSTHCAGRPGPRCSAGSWCADC